MGIVRNYSQLATTYERRDVLDILEAGLRKIQPKMVMAEKFRLNGNFLKIGAERYSLREYDNIYLIGFGKGSGLISSIIYNKIGDRIDEGHVIDNVPRKDPRYSFALGDHPVPSENNFSFTRGLFDRFSKLKEDDLVLAVVCGGGSSMLTYPAKVSVEKNRDFTRALLASGADIRDGNTMRKHLSKVKGGGLAKLLYPATVVGMIFSDVPGNDPSVIASGPTSYDATTADEAWETMNKYGIPRKAGIERGDLVETPKDAPYMSYLSSSVRNVLMVTPRDALLEMKSKAEKLGYRSWIYRDDLQGEARRMGEELVARNEEGVLLAAGESTVKVLNPNGDGGRNREVACGALRHLDENTTFCSASTDGWDFKEMAGAIVDMGTVRRAREMGMDPLSYLDSNDTGRFFKELGDGNIETGKLDMNLSDVYISLRKKPT